MTNKDIEKNLKNGFSKISTNIDSSFLLHVGKEKNLEMKKQKKPIFFRNLAFASFACLLVFVTLIGFYINDNNKLDSIVQMDVNPSVEIKLNKKNRVISVNALNDDAIKIINEMDLKGTDLNTATNAIIGSMVVNGYISELANSILISVDNKDSKKAEELQNQLMEQINSYLNNKSFEGAVVTQAIDEKSNTEKLAESNNISEGKATLINKIIVQNDLLKFEDLAKLSINELNILNKKYEPTSLTSSGSASDKAYIGEDKALEIALNHAKLKKSDVTVTEIDIDYDDGYMVYEIEFKSTTKKYDYEIDAKTGKIIEYDVENRKTSSSNSNTGNSSNNNTNNNNNTGNTGSTSTTNYIGNSKALDIALKHAGTTKDKIRDMEVELEKHENKYEVSFDYNGYEYEYDIHAVSGKILKTEKERED